MTLIDVHAAAVALFKAGIQLELTRRENDDRVLALNVTMCDMMSILTMWVSGLLCPIRYGA